MLAARDGNSQNHENSSQAAMLWIHSIIRRAAFIALASYPAALLAQRQPGHSIGKVTTIGNLVALELDSGAVDSARLFDLDHRTLRFTPGAGGYRVENVPLVWDAEFGSPVPAMTPTVVLEHFKFPFSGRSWDTANVAIGAITFGAMQGGGGDGGRRGAGGAPVGNRTGAGLSARAGFAMERYPTLETVGRSFINMIPGIAAFVKPNLNGQRFVKDLPDRLVVTWNLTEPYGGIQAFTWTPTVNRIQTVLHNNGVIELSYNDVSARDAVVGVFPLVNANVEKTIATFSDAEDTTVAPNLDVRKVTLSSVDGLFMRATIETRGSVLPEGDPGINGVAYRVAFDAGNGRGGASDPVAWTVRGVAGGRGGRGGFGGRYVSGVPGVEVAVAGNTISMTGILPREISGASRVSVWAGAATGTPLSVADSVVAKSIELKALRSPEVDLSTITKKDGPFQVVYEGFHWMEVPRAQDVACSVINTLGDKFDFIATYSDFRVDNPEGGTPSTGPRGGNVSGIGTSTNGLENYCSKGELQWMYVEPVSTAAVQSEEHSPDGKMHDYDYAMSQIGHELGHRWAADARAIVNGSDTITLGPVHWATGVHLPAAFPYSRPIEADAMGGSTWKDNGDGTFTQLDRDYYSPAKGYSWLGLYLMGLAKPDEVPPFFILRNLKRTGRQDDEGHPIYTGEKTTITIQDVIAAMGPRVPDFDHAQKKFNTAIVVVTEHGKKPTAELLTAANNIAQHWIAYWAKTTGGRSEMTVTPQP